MTFQTHRKIIAGAQRYGIHGTLKPPFQLSDTTDLDLLMKTVSIMAEDHQAFTLPKIEIRALGKFLTLCPASSLTALDDLAKDCVTRLDILRHPASEQEKTKRRKAGLSDRQDAMLEAWGYPYVLDEFRFHITLTGPLEEDHRATVLEGLKNRLSVTLSRPLSIEDLCIFGDPADGSPFRLITRIPL
jgi:hypothetical protein